MNFWSRKEKKCDMKRADGRWLPKVPTDAFLGVSCVSTLQSSTLLPFAAVLFIIDEVSIVQIVNQYESAERIDPTTIVSIKIREL